VSDELERKRPASERELQSLPDDLPDDYVRFLTTGNEASSQGSFRHVILYSVPDALAVTERYAALAPELFFVGSDGGSIGYAIHMRSRKYVEIHFMDIGDESPTEIATDFPSFTEYLKGI
jgi:hypothetical protein